MARSESKSSRSGGNRDMLSSLPDSVLHHIMSFMPARQAVQLCVLSKRWKTLWTTLPALNCGFLEISKVPAPAFCRMVERLTEFVNMVLLLRHATSQLHTLTFDCGSRYSLPENLFCMSMIRSWIRYAIKCNLRVLTINIWINKTILLLPSEVFTCPSLEYVTLTSIGCIDTCQIINLPSLKRLYLRGFKFDKDFMSKLLCGCPVLEDLCVMCEQIEFSKITSHSLKHLEILEIIAKHQRSIESSEMIINSPNLLSFHFVMCSCCKNKRIILNMPSLSKACIKLDHWYADEKLDVTKSNILCGLINVNRLDIRGNWIRDCLEAEISKCRTFSKLTRLSVDHLCLICRFGTITLLLEHCPNLKKLSLVHCGCICEKQCMSKQINVARFKCEQLETVEVKFSIKDRTFYWVVKCLQEAVTELRNCCIITTSNA